MFCPDRSPVGFIVWNRQVHMTPFRRPRWFSGSAFVTLMFAVLGAPLAGAQTYPYQPIRLVVPFAAGGGVDIIARIVGPKLGELLGQPIIIENRAGAGGMLGAASVAQATPDGYTLLLGTGSTHGTNPAVYAKVSYDAVKDFIPIVPVTTAPLLLVVNPGSPAKSVQDLIDYARAYPGAVSFGSYGTGSISHLAAELFNSMVGIKANHIPYRGSAPAMADLIGGRLDYMFDGVSVALGYIQSGSARLLGVGGDKRSPVLPDRATISESGVPGYEASVWFGLFAPAGTPQPIVDLINAKTNAVLADPMTRTAIERIGVEVWGGTSDTLAAKVKTELAKWAAITKEKNIRIEQ
jgi:tripartite-type tricarboxylate transporter receptor subunit TctC